MAESKSQFVARSRVSIWLDSGVSLGQGQKSVYIQIRTPFISRVKNQMGQGKGSAMARFGEGSVCAIKAVTELHPAKV